MPADQDYRLIEGAQVIDDGSGVARVRKGVWNFAEFEVDVTDESDEVAAGVLSFLNALQRGERVSPDAVAAEYADSAGIRNRLESLAEQLDRGGFVIGSDEMQPANRTSLALLGEKAQRMREMTGGEQGRVLYFADAPYLEDAMATITEPLSMTVDAASDDLVERIRTAGLTDRTDAIETKTTLEELTAELDGYDCVMGCFSSPNVVLLRNLNRLLIEEKLPMAAGFIDGPFLSSFTIQPPETGCFECYEHRLLARMEDHHSYNRFVQRQREAVPEGVAHGDESSPLLHWLASIVASEGFLLSSGPQISKFMGRALNVYLPLFEIQAQDLLRMPTCEACQYSQKEEIDELYTSTANTIDKMLEEIDVVPTDGD